MNETLKGCGLLSIIGTMLLGFGGLLVIGNSNWFWRAAERTVGPDAAINSYEWYEQQLKDIKAVEGQIKDAESGVTQFKEDNGEAKSWAFDQRGEYARLTSNLTGLKQSRHTLIQDYNAKASMVTRNMWKSTTLPQHIEE